MALAQAVVWEINPATGSDLNGGGFRAGASGTDLSLSAPVLRTDIVIGNPNTKWTSAGTPFTGADAGNLVQITAGTGFTLGTYEITSVAAGLATVDRASGTIGSTGGTGRLGGPVATYGLIEPRMTGGNTIWIKSTAPLALSAGMNPVGGVAVTPTRILGYSTTRGDEGKPTLTNNGAFNSINASGSHIQFQNLLFDSAASSLGGVYVSGNSPTFYNCEMVGFNQNGFSIESSTSILLKCSTRGGRISGGFGFNFRGRALAIACVAEGPGSGSAISYPGFKADLASTPILVGCISRKHGGANGHGYWTDVTNGNGLQMYGCIAHGNGGDGYRASTSGTINGSFVYNCIFANNLGFGMHYATTPALQFGLHNFNAFYLNTLGARNNLFVQPLSIDMIVSPFVDAANGDFRLNNTNPGGAQLRAAGFPGVYPYIPSTVAYNDIGLQHADPPIAPLYFAV